MPVGAASILAASSVVGFAVAVFGAACGAVAEGELQRAFLYEQCEVALCCGSTDADALGDVGRGVFGVGGVELFPY